jgi:hypothetical protein
LLAKRASRSAVFKRSRFAGPVFRLKPDQQVADATRGL